MNVKEPRSMSRTPRRSREQGQMIVLMAGGIVAFLVMTAVIVDGGNAWAQQRQTQNGTDAAAQAGATVLAQKLGNDPTTQGAAAGAWDTATLAAINNIASANKNDPPSISYYTDICGVLLKLDGSKATGIGNAAKVGQGFPTSASTTPDCPAGVVGPVAGVEVHDSKLFRTYFAGAVGIQNFTAGASATAVTGFVQSCQSAEQGCAVLPVNVPVWFSVCVGKDLSQNQGTSWPLNTTLVLPLCFNSAGNIGWIDFTPPAGGSSEVVTCIQTPCNPAIPLPSWQFIAQTGTDHSSQVESALNAWDGQVVLLPMFDHTCGDSQPNQALVSNVGANYGCTQLDTGNGQNLWYRIPRFAAFKLQAAYTNGDNLSSCQNQSKQCLVGQFVHFIVSGTVGPGSGGGTTDTSTIGVQLIK
jgi:Putative Flp pilus-assembly TadE/G-like